MGFSIQEYWSGLPFPEDLPDPGIEPKSLTSPTLADRFCTRATWEAPWCANGEEQISSQLVWVYSELAWSCRSSGHRNAACRGLETWRRGGMVWTLWPQAGCSQGLVEGVKVLWVGKRSLNTGFYIERAMKKLSLGQDCKVTERLCSGPMSGAESTGCPYFHIASSCVAAGNCRRACFLWLSFWCSLLRKFKICASLKKIFKGISFRSILFCSFPI